MQNEYEESLKLVTDLSTGKSESFHHKSERSIPVSNDIIITVRRIRRNFSGIQRTAQMPGRIVFIFPRSTIAYFNNIRFGQNKKKNISRQNYNTIKSLCLKSCRFCSRTAHHEFGFLTHQSKLSLLAPSKRRPPPKKHSYRLYTDLIDRNFAEKIKETHIAYKILCSNNVPFF